jgi:hypothetical protein
MENSSAYHGHGPSPIPTHQSHPAAALVAFSQASSLSEALRLSRPFPQVNNNKTRPSPKKKYLSKIIYFIIFAVSLYIPPTLLV